MDDKEVKSQLGPHTQNTPVLSWNLFQGLSNTGVNLENWTCFFFTQT